MRTKQYPIEDFDLEQLRAWTAEAHAGQKYGDGPYTDHLDAGRAILREFGFSEATHKHLHGAFELHDVLEDCKHTRFNAAFFIERGVPIRWVRLAEFVTDEPGSNRKERKTKTYKKIRGHREGTILKEVDRLANVRRGQKNEMYRKEHPAFKAALFDPTHVESLPLWKAIEDTLYPAGMLKNS
jgi:guanosine-3',5'-bis(diphosphate) 3'-pyrophosphohydrolase